MTETFAMTTHAEERSSERDITIGMVRNAVTAYRAGTAFARPDGKDNVRIYRPNCRGTFCVVYNERDNTVVTVCWRTVSGYAEAA